MYCLPEIRDMLLALAAIFIPIILKVWSSRQLKQQEEQEFKSRTFAVLDDLNQRVPEYITVIIEKSSGSRILSYDLISNDKDLENYVFLLLNQYDYVCLGCNEELFDGNIVFSLRGNALMGMREHYDQYIAEYRKKRDSEAWEQIDKFLNKYAK